MAKHHPKHYFLNDTVYFLTAHVYKKKSCFQTDAGKQLLFDVIKKSLTEYQYKLYAWVILDNHYHIEFKTRVGDDLLKVMKQIHESCTLELNRIEQKQGRKIFQNYWDYCIQTKKDFYTHFNYIHHNPVKHSYVQEMGEYQFSSYNYWCKKKGKDWVASCFQEFPVVDFTLPKVDDF